MLEKQVKRFINKFDFIPEYDPRYPNQERSMSFGCYDGWNKLIWNLCKDIDSLLKQYKDKEDLNFSVFQVKEKLRGLRFYLSKYNRDDKHKGIMGLICSLITEAEVKSYSICEMCGEEGAGYTNKDRSWLYTRCEKCAKEEDLELLYE